MDKKIPTAVNTDINHAPVDGVISYNPITGSSMLGTLYWTIVIATPTRSKIALKTRYPGRT